MEATALLQSAGKQLGKWMVEEAKYLYAVKDKVEELQSELEWIRCFLRNADERKNDDEMIRIWISEINDLSYEAEDILEEYLLNVSHPRKHDGIWNFLRWATCALGDVVSTHQVGSAIDVLTRKLSKLSARMVTYGVRPASYGESLSIGLHSKKAELRRTHSHLPVDDIVGLGKDTTDLVELLMNNEKKVIAISGMAGSGKTTLARKVYRSVKERQFEKRAWIYVSQKFRPKDIIAQILLGLCANDQRKKNEIRDAGAQLEGMLYRELENKKCLVVLDDIWKASDWDSLKSAFPIKANFRSKLLITTRNTKLVSHIDSQGFLHEMKRLNEMESLNLFNIKAFVDEDGRSGDPTTRQLVTETKKLQKQMVARCQGLPLAIVVLGGLLAPKKTKKEWESAKSNLDTFFSSNNDEENGIRAVFELSYTDLPYHLRPCFLHLGNFPEDIVIPTKKLYRMWIAEGIVATRDDNKAMNLETLANSYLQELVQRYIVQVVKKGPSGKIKTCRLHDIMREMCTFKAKEENFLSIVREENTNVGYNDYSSEIMVGKLHRVAIHFGQSLQSIFSYLQSNEASHLRSLMFFSSSSSLDNDDQGCLQAILNELKLLRILNLEDTGIDKLPREIGTLIHLRYLSMMGTRVRKLPSSIGKLRCLQTLDLRVLGLPDKRPLRIPDVLWRMKRLMHLYLPEHPYNCSVMRMPHELTKKFKKLRIKGLGNLEILKNFDTTRCRVNDLCQLEKLRKLAIKNEISKTETLKIIAECKSLKDQKLMHLSLKIHCSILKEEATILSSFSGLHNLEMAGTTSPMTELRLENVAFPENLTILYIKNCKLMCIDPLKNIKQLPNLTSLSLDNVAFSTNCMDCSTGGFLQLVHLKLNNMETLRECKVGEETMPKLRHLKIDQCENLQTIPDGLPTSVEVVCNPCVNGISRYFTCPYQQIELVDDDDDDLATRYCTRHTGMSLNLTNIKH